MEPSSPGASPREAAVSKGSPKTRRPKKSPSSTSRLSSGRRGPKVVNFKSPPRAVFKSSAAARQACGPDTAVRNRRALSTLPFPLRRQWQAVVTCLPLSDKAASAHVAALSHCQRYEPTGTATCPVERHALGLSLRRALALTPKPVLPWPPAEALHSAEPKPVLPPSLDLPPSRPGLRPNHSVQSLGSLMGDCAELEGLGTRFPSTFPAISAPLSSIVAMGPDDVPSPRSGQVRSRDSSRCGR